tara:strand:- start:1280 stop:1522 length:243 start_codon:yes stop_codon:yes gene_type:complete
MLKNLAKLNELEEIQKFKGDHQNKEINKQVQKKMDNDKKLIDPKYIFQTKAKNNNGKKTSMRKPKELEQNKKNPIKEYIY